MSTAAPVISVVIALYNAERYLPQCLASVRACAEDGLECILVNDGSTDGSGGLCADAAREDPRFRVITKENSGVSDSRNVGMAEARGGYVMFLDADDFIYAHMWPKIFAFARSAEADLISFGYDSLFPSGRIQPERFPIEGETSADPADTYRALLATPMLNTCWGKLLRRSVLAESGLLFDRSLVTCEDAVFMVDFVHIARTFCLCNLSVLSYRIHPASATRRRSFEDRFEDFTVLYTRRAAFFDAHPEIPLAEVARRECFSVITNLLLEYASAHDKGQWLTACAFILGHPVAGEILARLDPGAVSPFYKRLELALLRRRRMTPLYYYFKAKSRFLAK